MAVYGLKPTSLTVCRPLFSRETVSSPSPIDGPSTDPTAAPPTASTECHPVRCSVCRRVVATGTTTTAPSISIPSTGPPPVQQPSSAPTMSFADCFDPQKFIFEFKHGKDKHWHCVPGSIFLSLEVDDISERGDGFHLRPDHSQKAMLLCQLCLRFSHDVGEFLTARSPNEIFNTSNQRTSKKKRKLIIRNRRTR